LGTFVVEPATALFVGAILTSVVHAIRAYRSGFTIVAAIDGFDGTYRFYFAAIDCFNFTEGQLRIFVSQSLVRLWSYLTRLGILGAAPDKKKGHCQKEEKIYFHPGFLITKFVV
jgi:hypothetical protein